MKTGPDPLGEAVAHIHAYSGRNHRRTSEHGARELLVFLAARGKTVEQVTAEDVLDFERDVHAREAYGRAWAMVEGARIYLRFLSCRGEIREDEALFFALNEVITPRVLEATFGDGLRPRVLREAMAFGQSLSIDDGSGRRNMYQRIVIRLLLFLDGVGRTPETITPEDWVRFEEKVRDSMKPSVGPALLVGARAYLRYKGVSAELGRLETVWRRPGEIRALAVLSPEARRLFFAFRARLTDIKKTSRKMYAWGGRELLVFLTRRGVSIETMTVEDWKAFERDLRARVERHEIGRSFPPVALVGARRLLREHAAAGGALDRDMLPYAVPSVEALEEIAASRDPLEAEILREVDAFGRARAALGYKDKSSARRGVWSLLRYLAARGKKLHEITRQDWDGFSREALAGTGYTAVESLLVGASVYLRMKEREGVIAKSPVPPRPVKRTMPPVLPEGLAAASAALEDGMAAHDFAEHTRHEYRRAVWDLLAWAHETHGITRVSEITRDRMTEYRLRLQTEPGVRGALLSVTSQIGTLSAVRFFFSWLVKTGWMLADPTRHLPYPRRPQYLPRSLKVLDLARLLRSLPTTPRGLRDRAMVELLWGTGMRRAELARLKLTDVDLDARQILIREGKGRKDRIVPLGAKAKQALLDYLSVRPKMLRGPDAGSLFVGWSGGPLGKNGVSYRLHEIGKRILLKVSPHMLRHSCATHLLKGRADIRHIQKLLGHASLQSTERYTAVEMADLRNVIRRCHPREKGRV